MASPPGARHDSPLLKRAAVQQATVEGSTRGFAVDHTDAAESQQPELNSEQSGGYRQKLRHS